MMSFCDNLEGGIVMREKKFGTCLNCIDGRLQLLAIDWIKKNYNIDCVDMITELDMIGKLSKNRNKSIDHIVKNIKHSLANNKSEAIFIVGYGDIPNSLTEQRCEKEDVVGSADILRSLFPDCKIVGLWVTGKLEIELINKQAY